MREAPDKKIQRRPVKKATNGLTPDLGTLAGLGLALAGILGGLILEKGSIQDVAQTTAAMIVLGGTFGAVLVTTPLPVFLRALKELRHVFLKQPTATSEMIDTLIKFATQVRKHGIVSLEWEAETVADPFLRKALNLAVDGTDLNEFAQDDGNRYGIGRTGRRTEGQGLGGGGRLFSDNRHHRSRHGTDPGNETPGRY